MIDLSPTDSGRSRQLDAQSTDQRVQEPADSGVEERIRPDILKAGESGSFGADGKSCMSCDQFLCAEMIPCVKFSYAPGSDVAEKVKASDLNSPAFDSNH